MMTDCVNNLDNLLGQVETVHGWGPVLNPSEWAREKVVRLLKEADRVTPLPFWGRIISGGEGLGIEWCDGKKCIRAYAWETEKASIWFFEPSGDPSVYPETTYCDFLPEKLADAINWFENKT